MKASKRNLVAKFFKLIDSKKSHSKNEEAIKTKTRINGEEFTITINDFTPISFQIKEYSHEQPGEYTALALLSIAISNKEAEQYKLSQKRFSAYHFEELHNLAVRAATYYHLRLLIKEAPLLEAHSDITRIEFKNSTLTGSFSISNYYNTVDGELKAEGLSVPWRISGADHLLWSTKYLQQNLNQNSFNSHLAKAKEEFEIVTNKRHKLKVLLEAKLREAGLELEDGVDTYTEAVIKCQGCKLNIPIHPPYQIQLETLGYKGVEFQKVQKLVAGINTINLPKLLQTSNIGMSPNTIIETNVTLG